MSSKEALTFFFLALLINLLPGSLSSSNNPETKCVEAERQALIDFKHGFDEPNGILADWDENRECCEWIGVRCSPKTGHVIGLDLSPLTFVNSSSTPESSISGGKISASLVELRRLEYLDLSHVAFHGLSSIPSFLGGLRELTYLNLAYTSLTGEIPRQLGNLSNLQVLDLRSGPESTRTVTKVAWLSRLSALRVLDLSYTNMSLAKDWVNVVNGLPSLETLVLKECSLPDVVLSRSDLSMVNSSKTLAVLDLSYNSGPISSLSRWLFNYSRSLVRLDLSGPWLGEFTLRGFEEMASLEYLDLSGVKLGPVPESFGANMTAMKVLLLQGCDLRGNIPRALGKMSSLEHLNLENNMLGGEIPKSIWEICTLQSFKANNNNLSGHLNLASESSSKCSHFSLEVLELANNRITGSLPDFTLYPSLQWLSLSSNQLNGNVSKSIGQLSKLESLLVSNNFISGVISEAHLSRLFSLKNLDLSFNSDIVFDVSSDWAPPFQLYYIRLANCKLGPRFPSWLRSQKTCLEIDMSETGISGPIPPWFWNFSVPLFDVDLSGNKIAELEGLGNNKLVTLKSLDLSSNQLVGSLPASLFGVILLRLSRNKFTNLNQICNVTEPHVGLLDVSYNELSGELPDCWSNLVSLTIVSLMHNKLSGKIPSSLGFLQGLGALRLSNNDFEAEFPLSFKNLSQLMVLDVGQNRLSGPVPTWIGQNLTDLIILSLRGNLFNGTMPSRLCRLRELHVLDLSSNGLSGTIPSCLGDIEGMKVDRTTYLTFVAKSLSVTWKGVVTEFENLEHLKNIDLSGNKFVGEIPRDIAKLVGLVSLNLSRNDLSGQIPNEIGQLKSLDALDLSNNKLCGQIPSSLGLIDRLSTLDLSNNILSGKIPTGTQLQTRDAWAYLGNPELCGDPLPKKCQEKDDTETLEDSEHQEDQDSLITRGFYISLVVGLVVGFWGVCGTLTINKSWRDRYFKFW